MEFKQLHKKALWCMYTADAIISVIFIVGLSIAMHYFSLFSYSVIKVIYFLLLALVVAGSTAVPIFRYRRYRYALDNEGIYIREGFLWITENIVPVERLHKIALMQGPIDRFYGLSKVVVTTAGGDVTIRFLEYETAQFIADSLKKKINTIVLEEKDGE